jgi:hypothetical protein
MYSKNLNLYVLTAIFMVFGTSGCASRAIEKQVDVQAAKEKPTTQRELRNEAKKRIETSTTLTESERRRLLALVARTETAIAKDSQVSVKLRALLIEDIIKPDYEDEEIQIIKMKIMRAENNRLNTILNATIEANKILGRSQAPRDGLQWFILEDALSSEYTESL